MVNYEELSIDDQLILMTLEQDEKDRHKSAKNKAIDKLIEKFYTRAFSLQLQRGACNIKSLNEAYDFMKVEEELEKKRLDALAEENGCKEKEDYTFITICPADQNISPAELQKDMEKIVSKTKWINESDYAYVIEQRSEDEVFTGVHAHLLVHTPEKTNYEIRREMKNKVKHLVDMNIVKSFDIGKNKKGPLSILPTADFKNRMSYMIGMKSDEEKHKKQKMDRIMRKTYNLENVYFSGKLFSSYILEYNSQNPEHALFFQKESSQETPNISA